MENLLSALDAILREKAPDLYADLQVPAAETDLAELASLGRTAPPDEVLQLFAWKGGQSALAPGNLFDGWRWLQLRETLMEMTANNELYDMGEFMHEFWWSPNWIPLFVNDDGELLVVDPIGAFGGAPGQVLQVSMESPNRVIH